jgi:hypothetical protein
MDLEHAKIKRLQGRRIFSNHRFGIRIDLTGMRISAQGKERALALLSGLSRARLVCHTRRMASPSINRYKNHESMEMLGIKQALSTCWRST